MARLGIDIGTTNTLVATVNGHGEPELWQFEGMACIPSAIYVEAQAGNIVIGRDALDSWADPEFEPNRVFRSWKLGIGEGRTLATLDTATGAKRTTVTPEWLTTQLVERILGRYAVGLGGAEIESVLVTVPHGWRRDRPEKCTATRMAAEAARVHGRNVIVQPKTVSEPVAAAAYWIWSARRNGSQEPAAGRHVLVCDVGGGTFDLSLVQVGGDAEPHDVVSAANIDVAGDYVDALLLAWLCQQFNQKHGTALPPDVVAVRTALESGRVPFLRRWCMQVREAKERLSVRAHNAANRIVPVTIAVTDDGDRALTQSLDDVTFLREVAPFYRAAHEATVRFVRDNLADTTLYGVLFAGGASQTLGLRQAAILPALVQCHGAAEAQAILDRIPVNTEKLDRVIAMGAALIANDIVQIRERLLYDVGLVGEIRPSVAAQLGLPPSNQIVLVTPILVRNSSLPAVVSGDALVGPLTVGRRERLKLRVVIQGDDDAPREIAWDIENPLRDVDKKPPASWQLEADVEGQLILRLQMPGVNEIAVRSQLWRRDATLGISGRLPRLPLEKCVRVAPERMAQACKAAQEAEDTSENRGGQS